MPVRALASAVRRDVAVARCRLQHVHLAAVDLLLPLPGEGEGVDHLLGEKVIVLQRRCNFWIRCARSAADSWSRFAVSCASACCCFASRSALSGWPFSAISR